MSQNIRYPEVFFGDIREEMRNYNLRGSVLVISKNVSAENPLLEKEFDFVLKTSGTPILEDIPLLEKDINILFAVGGGSTLDYGKLLYDTNKLSCKKIFAPTTYGSGSEGTCFAVYKQKGDIYKKARISESYIPDKVVFDHNLYLSLSFENRLFPFSDALSHASESYMSNKSNWLSNMLSYKVLESFLDSDINLENLDKSTIEKLAANSFYAGVAENIAGCGLGHVLGYILEAEYNYSHGLANLLTLPIAIELYCKKVCHDAFLWSVKNKIEENIFKLGLADKNKKLLNTPHLYERMLQYQRLLDNLKYFFKIEDLEAFF